MVVILLATFPNSLLTKDSRVLLKGGTVMTITKGTFEDTDILIADGKIVRISPNIDISEGALVIDAAGKTVIPGMIDLLSHIATMGSSWRSDEGNEQSGPSVPQVNIMDSINPFHHDFKEALSGGVTTVLISPGSKNVIAGIQTLLKCYGEDLESMIIQRESGMKFGIYNKSGEYGGMYPSTMMGISSFLRDIFSGAKKFTEGLAAWEASGKKTPRPRNQIMEPLSKVLSGELVARMHAENAREILTAIDICQEFSIRLDLIHALDAYKVIDAISSKKINVIYGPFHPAYSDESYKSPALLDKAGVTVCLTTDSPVYPQKHLRYQAILAVKYGMTKESALMSITYNPAKIAGVSDRIGSLEPGKDADIVILNGHPLDMMSQVETVLVNGKICYQRHSIQGGMF